MTGLYTSFVSNFLFPLQERLKEHSTVKVHRGMEASQWWPRERLAALQLARLRRLLTLAGEHVPYYRDMFRSLGLDPQAIAGIGDLQRLPLLTKSIIRTQGERLKSECARGLARFNTGGSSGEPLIFHIGKERVSHDVAAKWRATRWWDVDIGDTEIVVWGSPIELGAQDHMRALRDRLMRTELLPAFEMSEANLDQFVARIRARRPKMLFAYPSSLSLIATHAKKKNLRLDNLGIRVAFVTSERLYDHQRATIESAFGCPVANGYGGRDAGFIAHQCPHGSLHLTAEDIIVEIVDDTGRVLPAGETGEIVVTHLATPDFPFIRYRTGDIGILSARNCPCGRGLPLLADVQGRTTDFVVAADGTIMHGLALIYVVRDLPEVARFRIVQESRQLTRVEVVPADGWGEGTARRIREGLGRRLGQGVEVRIEPKEQIAAEKSGKFRYVVSRAMAGAPAEGGICA